MTIQWNLRDLLRLTRDCDLGLMGTLLHVVNTDGPYMTVRVLERGSLLQHVGRDYPHAVKVGEGAIDRADKPPPWSCCASKAELVMFAHDVRAYFKALDEVNDYYDNDDVRQKLDDGAIEELEETEAILRAHGASVTSFELLCPDVSDEGLRADAGPGLVVETLLPTSCQAFCVKCGVAVESDGAECPRCGVDTVVHDTDETEE